MSIMNDLADEVLKPVKTGLFVGAAVVTVGGLAIAANSETGREFLGNVSNAVKGKPNNADKTTKQVENKPETKTSKEDDDAVNMIDDNTQKTNVKGSSNV